MSNLQHVHNAEQRSGKTVSHPTLVERAKALASVLQERAAETNELRRLPDTTWKDLLDSGIIRGLQPAR